MAKEVRQGAALICVALACLLLSVAVDGQGAVVLRGAAILFGIGGLVVAALGFMRESTD